MTASTDRSGLLARVKNGLVPLSGGLGTRSLRGRYLLISGCFALVVLGAVWLAEVRVGEATHRMLANDQHRHEIRHNNLRLLIDAVWAANAVLQRYLVVPDEENYNALNHNLARARAQAQRLQEYPWIKANPESLKATQVLSKDLAQLAAEVEKVIRIRDDVRDLFPASRIQQDTLLPASIGFYTAATLAMDEALELSGQPGQYEIYVLFSKARHTWTQMIGAYRLYIANRFGIFGDPEVGMRAQAGNIDLYSEAVAQSLDALSQLDDQGKLQFQQAISLVDMKRFNEAWHVGHKQAVAVYTSDRWRTDVPLLRDTVQPLFDQVWQRIRILDYQIDVSSTADLVQFKEITIYLGRYIWLLLLLAFILIAMGFLFFEHSVRRPITRVAAALRAEAEGKDGPSPPAAHIREIEDLVGAFAHMRQQVYSRRLRLETILDNTAECIITFDAMGIIDSFNQAAEELFGYTEEEVINKDIGVIVAPPIGWKPDNDYVSHFVQKELPRLIGSDGEFVGRRKSGTTFPIAIKVSTMVLEDRQLYAAVLSDCREQKAMIDHLTALAEHDGLTGLYNRTYFQQELERVVERAKRTAQSCILLYIDLDNFKFINDTLGHAAGDRALGEISKELLKRARKSDLVARLGGDEFTVLLYNVSPQQGLQIADDFRKRISDYVFVHGGEAIDVGCSIGVAVIGADSASADEVLSQADLACHLAKRGGRNRVRLYDPEDQADVATMTLDMGWPRRIKNAIEKGHLALACQPIVATQSREVESFEVLIRMLDEDRNLIMPGGFLPSAERFGLASEIDKWVIAKAVDNLAAQRKTTPSMRYSINLSAQTLSDLSVCDLILEKLESTGLNPAALTFEITETAAISDMGVAARLLSRLQQIGCKTALDDFGSGMPSFAYLRDLPVDIVKIDGRFVKNLARSTTDRAMVKGMNEIAHALGKKTVAEFVQDEASFMFLAEYGVDYAQGYHLGRPELRYTPWDLSEKRASHTPATAKPQSRSTNGPEPTHVTS